MEDFGIIDFEQYFNDINEPDFSINMFEISIPELENPAGNIKSEIETDLRPNEPEKRFQSVSVEEIAALKDKSRNINTVKTTKTWINTFQCWAKENNKREDIENIPPTELNVILEKFYAELRKKDSTDYEPESLAVMQASIDRYLKERNYATSIIRGTEFYSSNLTLKGKAAELREKGKGSRPNASKPLTKPDEDELWKGGKLGTNDPETLIHTVWHLLTQYLGFRGRQEHKIAEIQDFQFSFDENNVEFVEYNDCKPTKTRPGALRANRRSQRPRMYANGTERCPVRIFKNYISHRPEQLRDKGPLYLSTIINPKGDVWYKNQKMGVNRIGDIMKRIVAGTKVEGTKKLTNHSARKTLVKKLDDASVPRDKIIAVTGHRNEKSLDDYVDSMNHKQSRELSDIISGVSVSPPAS